MSKIFRSISLIEGTSYLLILCVSLGFISREFVSVIGMAHGVLFILYLLLATFSAYKQGWPITTWLLLLLASVVPFAFLLVERFIQKELRKKGFSDAYR